VIGGSIGREIERLRANLSSKVGILRSQRASGLTILRVQHGVCSTKTSNESDVNIIMLDAWKDKLEFPELKAKAKEMYDEWQPDACITEAKAAGAPLIFELRRMGVYVSRLYADAR